MSLNEVHRDAGSMSVEFALVMLAAAAFAALLYAVVTSGVVHDLLTALVEGVLEPPG